MLATSAVEEPSFFQQSIKTLFESPHYQPPALPVVALRLIELSQHPAISYEEILRVLEQDALLAAKVLARMQSALYGTSPVRTLKHALVRLGLGGIRNLVLEIAMGMRVFRAEGLTGPMDSVRAHSFAIAHAARMVGNAAKMNGDFAFLCGLLHDAGAAAILVSMADGAVHCPASTRALWEVLDGAHREATAVVARLWKLPDEIRQITAGPTEPASGYFHPMSAVLTLAHHLCVQTGDTMAPAEAGFAVDALADGAFAGSLEILRLNAAQIEELENDFARLRNNLGQGAACG